MGKLPRAVLYIPIQPIKHRDNQTKVMIKMTYKKPKIEPTAEPKRPIVVGLTIALILTLYACSMPSPTNNGSSSSLPSGSSGSPSPGGGVPSPGGGAPNPGGDPGGSTPPSGGGGSAGRDQSSDESGSGTESGTESSSGEGGESIEGLDQALDESLEDFDETVMGEGSGSDGIDILSPTGTSGGIDSDEPLFEEGDSGAAQGSASIEQRAAEGAPPGAAGGESAAEQAASASAAEQEIGDIIPIPDDIDDGQGDDIVLRQIRDAALKERDPILREKLWDEYRRIKNQS